MRDSYDDLKRRFPILETVIDHLDCTDSDKRLLKELFLNVYSTGYEDGEISGQSRSGNQSRVLKKG